jgi:hypothetical protein
MHPKMLSLDRVPHLELARTTQCGSWDKIRAIPILVRGPINKPINYGVGMKRR